MAQDVTIERITEKAGVKEFVLYPWAIYEHDPLWIPPIVKEQLVVFSPRYPFFEHGEMDLFLARRGQDVVGRVAAILDRDFVNFSGDRAAFFGFFEAVEDRGVAGSLFDAVRVWARKRDVPVLRGPFNPSTNDECGLLVDGFDKPPMLMMPYNPPYYPALIESSGLKKRKDLYAYIVETDMQVERLEKLAPMVRKRLPDLTIRPVRLKRIQGELRIIMNIYNDAWRENWGFVPITKTEMDFMASRLKPLAVEDLVLIAEVKGEPVAFIVSFPDYNQVLKRLNGRVGLIGALKFLYYSRQIQDLRTMLLGVKRAYQKRGIEGLLYLETFKRGLMRGFRRSELSWVLEDNVLMRRGIEMLGGKIHKTYRIYEGLVS